MEFSHKVPYFDILTGAQKGYSRAMEPLCRQWELTKCEMDIVLFLYNNPQFRRAADIVRFRGIAKSHVSMGVRVLEQRGLLRRDTRKTDRRSTELALTEQGLTLGAQARLVQKEYLERIYAGITQEEFAVWQTITDKIWENIEKIKE